MLKRNWICGVGRLIDEDWDIVSVVRLVQYTYINNMLVFLENLDLDLKST